MRPLEPDQEHDKKSTHLVSTASSRRSFLIKGVAATPILASFINKPVWAVDVICSSDTASGNASHHPNCIAMAQTATFWTANPDQWPSGIFPDDTFKLIFNTEALQLEPVNNIYHQVTPITNTLIVNASGEPELNKLPTSTTLLDVLTSGEPVDQELVAAFLNISHAGIDYQGPIDLVALLINYQQAKANYKSGLNVDPLNPNSTPTPDPATQTNLNNLFTTLANNLNLFNMT